MQQGNFTKSKDVMYKGNGGYINVCSDCLNEIAMRYAEELKSVHEAIRRICMKFNFYYSLSIANDIVKELNEGDATPFILKYVRSINLRQYSDKNFDTTLKHEKFVATCAGQTTDEDREQLAEYVREWGSGYKDDDYIFLNDRYVELTEQLREIDPSQKILIKNICETELDLRQARFDKENFDTNKVVSLQKSLVSLINAANIKPSTEMSSLVEQSLTMGNLIKRCEETDPIGDPLPEWADPDGMNEILQYTIGGIGAIFNIKNSFMDKYYSMLDKFSGVKRDEAVEEFDINEFVNEHMSYERDSDDEEIVYSDDSNEDDTE